MKPADRAGKDDFVVPQTRLSCAPLMVGLMLASCVPADPRPALEVTMRDGTMFVIAHASVDYERICGSGAYAFGGDPEKAGLRVAVPLERAGDRNAKPEIVPWPDIVSVDFGERTGRLGFFCGDLPEAIAAAVHLKDGRIASRLLIDTTETGLQGITERGPITIPLREVKFLRPIADVGWSWVAPREGNFNERQRRREGVTLRVEPLGDQAARDVAAPVVTIPRTKVSDGLTLSVPAQTAYGLPVRRAGARLDIPWHEIARVDMLPTSETPSAAVTWQDGRTETFGVQDGLLAPVSGTAGDGLDLTKIARIEVRVVEPK